MPFQNHRLLFMVDIMEAEMVMDIPTKLLEVEEVQLI